MPSSHLVLENDIEYVVPSNAAAASRFEPWPERLAILVYGPEKAYAYGTAGGEEVDSPVDWKGDAVHTTEPLQALQAAAEVFRVRWEKYLNDINPSDLADRLRAFGPVRHWADRPYAGDADHEQAWAEVAVSEELRQLAYQGYYLYGLFFPPGSTVRHYLDALKPGARLDISWQVGQRYGHVPWALMYSEPLPNDGEMIDAASFLGLRLRLAYSPYNPKAASRLLGPLDSTHRGICLFWGDQEGEPAVAEARRQYQLWSADARHVIIPRRGDASDPKAALKSLLKVPTPRPMGILYFFCHCGKDDQKRLVLRFGNTNNPPDVLLPADIALDRLDDRPLVFVNGCATAVDTNPVLANDLETKFFLRDCRTYIGTVAKVPVELAGRFATAFFELFCPQGTAVPLAAGEALFQARTLLWNHYRNLGGLYYTCINTYDLTLIRQ